MNDPLIIAARLERELQPAPINPAWIRSGSPRARYAHVAGSADGRALTCLWECSAGEFDWHYDLEETVYVLGGSVVLESESLPPTRYGAGDVIFFKRGATVRWYVEDHIRKLAFCRGRPESILRRAARVLQQRLRAIQSAPRAIPASWTPAH